MISDLAQSPKGLQDRAVRHLFDPDIPFAAKRIPVFYGWVIVAIGTLTLFASIPGQTMGVSVFNDALIEATGLSRLSVANAYLSGTIMSGLCMPWAGALLDRLGARRMVVMASLGLASMLIALSYVGQFSSINALGTIAAFVVLAVLFFGLRFTGQGVLAMTARTTMARWFQEKRGLVAGISGVFVGFAFGLAPRVLDGWIDHSGWRGAWREMGFAIALGFGLLAWLFFRDNPESSGLSMDGKKPAEGIQGDDGASRTRAEAIRTLAFWAITLTLASQALITTGLTFHIVDIGAKSNLDRSAAVAIFLPMAIVSTTTGLFGGVLADRTTVRRLLVTSLLAQLVGLIGSTLIGTSTLPLIIGFGISGGLFSPVAQVAYPRFFGRKHLGSIAGIQMMAVVLGSAIGPSLFALSESWNGGYRPALVALLTLPLGCLALTVRIGNGPLPRHSSETSTGS